MIAVHASRGTTLETPERVLRSDLQEINHG
jgi:hypothetical protein